MRKLNTSLRKAGFRVARFVMGVLTWALIGEGLMTLFLCAGRSTELLWEHFSSFTGLAVCLGICAQLYLSSLGAEPVKFKHPEVSGAEYVGDDGIRILKNLVYVPDED